MKIIFSRSHKKFEVCALLLVSLAAWWIAAPVRGKFAAHLDVARGNYRLLTFGLPPSWRGEYARLLRERYGVELKPVAGCIVSQGLIWYVDAYDEVSAAAATRKYGHDIFEECEKEARKNWEVSAAKKPETD
jgi:hypothetical protein